jgi:lysozyme
MKISTTFKAQIKAFEGLRLEAYPDGKKVSIGYGNTYYANGNPVKLGDVISKQTAEILFDKVITECENDVTNLLKIGLSQSQFDALVSFRYNIGLSNFTGSTLVKKAKVNPNDSTIAYEFSRWIYSKGEKVEALVTRRAKEAAHYFNGTAQNPTSKFNILAGIAIFAIIYKIKNNEEE